MEQVLVSQTKNYLVLKIPLGDPERAAVLEGLEAIKEGRVSETFNGAKEAIVFLK